MPMGSVSPEPWDMDWDEVGVSEHPRVPPTLEETSATSYGTLASHFPSLSLSFLIHKMGHHHLFHSLRNDFSSTCYVLGTCQAGP